MSKLIVVTIESSSENDNAFALYGYFNGQPTLNDLEKAYQAQYPRSNIDDLHFYGNPSRNMAIPLIHKPGIWRVELGGYV